MPTCGHAAAAACYYRREDVDAAENDEFAIAQSSFTDVLSLQRYCRVREHIGEVGEALQQWQNAGCERASGLWLVVRLPLRVCAAVGESDAGREEDADE